MSLFGHWGFCCNFVFLKCFKNHVYIFQRILSCAVFLQGKFLSSPEPWSLLSGYEKGHSFDQEKGLEVIAYR